MKQRLAAVITPVFVLMACELAYGISAPLPSAPPQLSRRDIGAFLFNSDFSTATLASQLACAKSAQTSPPPWKQGIFWENPVAPCSQIKIVADPVTELKVLDLEWTKTANAGLGYDDTAIDTFPLAASINPPGTVPSHFSFQYGYVEVVARLSTVATGVWPAIYMVGDTTIPFYTSNVSFAEFDML